MDVYTINNVIYHSYCFTDFNCAATVLQISIALRLGTLTKLTYNAIMGSLFSKDVITNEKRKIIIGDKVGEEKMMYLVVDIVMPSLRQNNYKKYKGFLEAMEESDDSDLKSMAEKLGKLITP